MSLTIATYQLGPGFAHDQTLDCDPTLYASKNSLGNTFYVAAERQALYAEKLKATAERLSHLADVLLIQTSTFNSSDPQKHAPFFEALKGRGFNVIHGSEASVTTYIAFKDESLSLVSHETIYFKELSESYENPLDATVATLKIPNSKRLITLVSLCFVEMVLFNSDPSTYNGDKKTRTDNLNYLTEVISRISLSNRENLVLLGGGFSTDRFNDDNNSFPYLDRLLYKEVQATQFTHVYSHENHPYITDGFWMKAPPNQALPKVSLQVPDNFINKKSTEKLSREAIVNTTSVSSHKPVILTLSFEES